MVACCVQEVTVAAALPVMQAVCPSNPSDALVPAAPPLPQAQELPAEDKVKELQQQVGGLKEQLALKDQQLAVLHDLSIAEDEAQRRQLVAADAKQHTVNTVMAHMIQSLHKVCGAECSSYATSRFWSP
jgi:hypothetical protein